MTAPTTPAITTGSFGGRVLRPPQVAQLQSAIVGGSPFLDSLTRLPTDRPSVAFPVLGLDDPEWLAEFDPIPVLTGDTDAYVVGVSKLGGIILITREALSDLAFNVTTDTQRVLRETFSRKAERDLIAGTASSAGPNGILDAAPVTAGADLWDATVLAKAEIADNGGVATHIAMGALAIGAEEGRRDEVGRPLYPAGLNTFAGLTVVSSPAASAPLVYDRARCFLIVNRDWEARLSEDYAPAFERDSVALRLTGRLNAAVPLPDRSVRQLDVPGGGTPARATATKKTSTTPAK